MCWCQWTKLFWADFFRIIRWHSLILFHWLVVIVTREALLYKMKEGNISFLPWFLYNSNPYRKTVSFLLLISHLSLTHFTCSHPKTFWCSFLDCWLSRVTIFSTKLKRKFSIKFLCRTFIEEERKVEIYSYRNKCSLLYLGTKFMTKIFTSFFSHPTKPIRLPVARALYKWIYK